ncbi:hypothetical protein [Salinivibrio proteolyticus]|uniref:IS110 family transposase n=1 Tax=Salinivibrio proteolyticus TaxID=334715 RepID=A0ABY7LIC0_9GAMM|nr:hypothetical protein [Salinivibrio proteolyticus]WBA16181.1 hypothetical protein N7E60_08495 [Salinivibrio proteolyticus]
MSTQFFCGVDLAKHHFSLHAVDAHGKVTTIHIFHTLIYQTLKAMYPD